MEHDTPASSAPQPSSQLAPHPNRTSKSTRTAPFAIYSQATNNQSPKNAGVSRQTGQYSHQTSLITLGYKDKGGFGAVRDFYLSYSVMSARTSNIAPYGCGWNLVGCSTYQPGQRLTLSTGQQFSFSNMDPNRKLHFHDQKTQDFHMFWVNTDGKDEYHVYHKDGVMEVLYENESGLYLLGYLVFPNGETYSFSYATMDSRTYLNSILDVSSGDTYDERTILLNMEYTSGLLDMVKVWRGDAYAYFYTNVIKGSDKCYLASMSTATAEGDRAELITFSYANHLGYQVIDEVTYPDGAREQIFYIDGGHSTPQAGTTGNVPRVNTYTYLPGYDMQPIVQEFQYPDDKEGDHNFMGYPNQYGWEENRDNLYNWGKPNSYQYWVQVTIAGDSENKTVVKTTYNTFHLKTSEVVAKNDCTMETTFEYPCDSEACRDKTFDEQPNNMMFPTKTTTKFKKGNDTNEYVRSAKHDDYGNQIETVDLSGVVEKSTYYPVEGEQGSCPADPFEFFQRFIKTHTTIDSTGTETKSRRHFYSSLKPLSKQGGLNFIKSVVKMSRIEVGSEDTPTMKVLLSYRDDPESLFLHNDILQAQMNRMSGDKTWTTTCDFAYKLKDNCVTTEKTITGHDGSSFSSSESNLMYSDLVVRMRDRNGIISEAAYDGTGNIISSTSATGSDYEERVTYEYAYEDEEGKACMVCTQTDANGEKLRITYNGSDDIVKVDKFSIDAKKYLTVVENIYNDIGLVEVEKKMDYLPSGQLLCSEQTVTKYDGWNQPCEVAMNDRVVQVFDNNPFNLTRSSHLETRDGSNNVKEKLAALTKTFDLFKNCTSERFVSESSGTAESKRIHDGFGRMVESLSPLGHSTKVLKYDELGRVEQVCNPAGVTFKLNYPMFTRKSLVSGYELWEEGLRNESILVGQQDFDGIGRVTRKVVDGVSTSYSYEGGKSRASHITTHAGNTISFEFNSALGTLPSAIGAWRGKATTPQEAESYNTYTYAKNSEPGCTGLRTASGKNGKYEVTYGAGGKMVSSTQIVDGFPAVTNYVRQTLLGKPLSATLEVDGKVLNMDYTYDQSGRLLTCSQSEMLATLGYDEFGRVNVERIAEGGVEQQVTELMFDDLNREISRKISFTCSGETQVYQYDYEYDSEGKICNRCVTANGHVKLEEEFAYDAVSRLRKYSVKDGYDNAFLPRTGKNGAGRAGKADVGIVDQNFSFNCRNSITSVVTKFEDGQTDTATYRYSDNSSKVASVEHSLVSHYPEKTAFTYDKDGNLTKVSSSTGEVTMAYSVSGRVLTLRDSSSGAEESFTYDPFERVQSDGLSKKYYRGNTIMLEKGTGDEMTEFVRCGAHIVAEKGSDKTTLIGADQFQSAVLAHDSTGVQIQTYDAYGNCDIATKTGYKGDLKTGSQVYLVGGGTRSYLPQFGMFSSMDSMSPFTGGGVNPYMYCSANPVNLTDPSGHWFSLFMKIVGVVVDVVVVASAIAGAVATGGVGAPAALVILGATFGIVSGTLGIAKDSLDIYDENHGTDHSKVMGKLGLASNVFGVASMATDLGGGVTKSVTKSAKAFDKKAAKAFKNAKKGPDEVAKHSGRGGRQKYTISKGDQFQKEAYYSKKRSEALLGDEKLIRNTPYSASISSISGIDAASVTRLLHASSSGLMKGVAAGEIAGQAFMQGYSYHGLITSDDWTLEDGDDTVQTANSFMFGMVDNKYFT